jgi:hypothetical protein
VKRVGAAEPCWSLEAALAIFGDVRRSTAEAVSEVEALVAERDRLGADDPGRRELDGRIQTAVSGWIRAMEAYGVEVKGPWLVDFDNGQGYYCWRWPEERLEYFHTYEEGFSGRTRIQ